MPWIEESSTFEVELPSQAIILMYLYAVGLDKSHTRASSVTVMLPFTYDG